MMDASKRPPFSVGYRSLVALMILVAAGCKQTTMPGGATFGTNGAAYGTNGPLGSTIPAQPASALTLPSFNSSPRVTPPSASGLVPSAQFSPGGVTPTNYLSSAAAPGFDGVHLSPSAVRPTTENLAEFGSIPMGNALERNRESLIAAAALPPAVPAQSSFNSQNNLVIQNQIPHQNQFADPSSFAAAPIGSSIQPTSWSQPSTTIEQLPPPTRNSRSAMQSQPLPSTNPRPMGQSNPVDLELQWRRPGSTP